ncbi:hypothetical protein [Bradyrhizobium cajani]|uniref:Uncharacterized protein n=1 Tax=Bradyrhizobium cajani TaxID=1928661 RepID=A0A844THJ8_9BRAD|nr:hypothetical protein [Bradyrhizobium cajani]MCP3370083.1 hypothetical protein [Bradyrhizobium cajani]MVT78677.1 hypothetical protein [Bradyrhizobium cajani]
MGLFLSNTLLATRLRTSGMAERSGQRLHETAENFSGCGDFVAVLW